MKTIALVQPNTLFGRRLHQLDIGFAKLFNVKEGIRLTVMADFCNVFNSSWVITYNNTFGSAWRRAHV